MSKPEIETLASKVVYQNRWMTVREDQIRRRDGSLGIYGVVEKSDFAVIAAVQNGSVYLVEQYRYPVGARCWELPQGTWDNALNGPLELANTELREETGLTAGRIQHVAKLHEAYGYSTQAFDLFFATHLTQGEAELEPEEQGLIAKAFPISTVAAMLCDGRITDAVTVASFGLLRLKGLL
ncbi:MAG TPA: NUDIX hydrolase [Candidatus Competibacter sp.]|nr:ADP-ribose pyrophosphatase [Candidatus Competibacteraceae bacterium]HRC73271.1 NUDIX hydrolase [Candidatus Competibacter sp.]